MFSPFYIYAYGMTWKISSIFNTVIARMLGPGEVEGRRRGGGEDDKI